MYNNVYRSIYLSTLVLDTSVQSYKYGVVSCPDPELLLISPLTNMDDDMCSEDSGCSGDQVCCSNGQARVCTDPVGE